MTTKTRDSMDAKELKDLTISVNALTEKKNKSSSDRQPLENPKIFLERRKKLAEKIQGSALILSSPLECIRNGSVSHPFRQNSNLYYLTGFEEPETIFVFRPGLSPETVLFVRQKDPNKETWDGFRFGPEEAAHLFQVDKAYCIDEFDKYITELLKPVDKLYYRMYRNSSVDLKVQNALEKNISSEGRSGWGFLPVYDSEELLAEFRLIKGPDEIANMRMATEISAEAHIELMKYVRPGINERELYGYFLYQIMKRGAAREGYGGIFASGASACTLHYVFNDQICKEGDLLLVDAGAEFNYYTGDITRTYPVGGRFREEQAEVYQGVLKVQKTVIDAVRPGVTFDELKKLSDEMLTELILDLGLITGRVEDVLGTLEYKKYYPHGIGHYLGMDVHDVGLYKNRRMEHRKLEEGMIFTVEPGLYIPAHDNEAAINYRGIGIRIEDNILVTKQGNEVLTSACPKEIEDIQNIMK